MVIFPLVVLVIVLALFAAVPTPQPASAQEGPLCFEESEYCIEGRIREFWEQNGELTVFGLPITPQREETIGDWTGQVQWFERNRLELHPENERPYDVLIGRLGADLLEQQQRNWYEFPKDEAPQDGCRYFAETQQNVCGELLTAWLVDGIDLNQDGISGNSDAESLALFGLPLSGRMTEVLGENGEEYQVQYFERARFELHPENEPPFNVLLGRLGDEILEGAEGDSDDTAGQPPVTPQPVGTPVREPTVPTREPGESATSDLCRTPINPDDAPEEPIRITDIEKVEEIVRLENVSADVIDLSGWTLCSIRGNEVHQGIGGILEPGESQEFAHTGASKVWENGERDDGMLFDADGTFISYYAEEDD
jgi:hypothetical protein